MMTEQLSLYELAETVRKALADANNKCHNDVVAELGPLSALLDTEVETHDDFFVVGGSLPSSALVIEDGIEAAVERGLDYAYKQFAEPYAGYDMSVGSREQWKDDERATFTATMRAAGKEGEEVSVRCEVCLKAVGKERIALSHITDEYLGDRDRETLLAAAVVCSLSCAEAWANRRAAVGKEG